MNQSLWNPTTWETFPAKQQPHYPDQIAHQTVLQQLSTLPPLVFPGEIDRLLVQLAQAGRGERFVLQGGDCAEQFSACRHENIAGQLKILLQVSLILTYGARRPVVRLGRIAGQYAKPRSSDTETIGDLTLPSYRGDIINDPAPELHARTPNPKRMLQAYYLAATTLNCARGMISAGFADLHNAAAWNLSEIENSSRWPEYRAILERLSDALAFMGSCGVRSDTLGSVDFFTSHEGLLLGFESALTRKDPQSGRYYNMGAHMIWIGERTRQLDGAHVEYCRGIANPIGIKLGPKVDHHEVMALLETLNPQKIAGKVTLITRMGRELVASALPGIVRAVHASGHPVVWSCDPMHGNTRVTAGNHKTRDFGDILGELEACFRIHREVGSRLGGVHFEMTGDNVTECTGGAAQVTDEDLGRNYLTACDPRLNASQSLEMAFLLSQLVHD